VLGVLRTGRYRNHGPLVRNQFREFVPCSHLAADRKRATRVLAGLPWGAIVI
jgi:hypothetical protein